MTGSSTMSWLFFSLTAFCLAKMNPPITISTRGAMVQYRGAFSKSGKVRGGLEKSREVGEVKSLQLFRLFETFLDFSRLTYRPGSSGRIWGKRITSRIEC